MGYYDHAATSPLLPEVRAAMLSAMDMSVAGGLGNASSLHSAGRAANELVESARAEVARLINADPDEIIFTSGGSESNNTVMHIFAGKTIACSDIEHPSVLEAAGEYGAKVVNCSFVGRKPGCSLVSIMLANNELGTIFDIERLAKEAHASGAFFHTDATQALGKIPVDVKSLGVDYLTASAHKIGGPTGVGILYVKKGASYRPLILGGHQEHGRRAGTSNAVGIAGFGTAAAYATKHKTWKIYESKIRPLRDHLAERILKEIPYSSLNTELENSLPNILNVSFAAAEGESTQLYLDLEGDIQVSTGSACASGDGSPSHVIMALTNDAEVAHSSIRFSFSLETTAEDIERIMATLPGIIKRLQAISTVKLEKNNETR